MARRLRTNLADGWYHVFHRGIERRIVYADDRDREHFLELLGEVHERFRIRIHAFSLMDNHWHGVLQTPDANLSAGMQWLHLSHAAWFNARHDRVGPLWQGRFRATPVENGAWAYDVSLYVHLNPVSTEEFGLGKRRKKVESGGLRVPSEEEVSRRLRALREYRWSSYRSYGGYAKRPKWLQTASLLARTGGRNGDRRRAYRRDAQLLLSKGVDASRKERLRDAIAIGSDRFVRHVKELAGGGERDVEGRRELRRRVRFAEVVDAVEKLRGESWEALANRRGDPGRPLAMWAARRFCGLTLREIGEQLNGLDYAAVSIALKRFEQKSSVDRRLKGQMRALAKMLNVET